ncbi:MAG: Ferric reductase domain protein transrane component, N-terminal domain [Gemmatimonadetes bacterium]|jgi:sulfoxide reductase heme-binding subunit YedZ|nr:Ferric reductase domain protein transrane component, N-terminal domain [Gemmatimonadota bacterium]
MTALDLFDNLVDAIDLSNYAGLAALGLLTFNILLGVLVTTHYNPVRRWPHHRINTVKIHNFAGWAALAATLLHPAFLLFQSRVVFRVLDLFYPVDAPKQPWVNTAGAAAAYVLILVVITSYFRFQIGRRWWKRLHFTTYLLFPLFAVHSLLTDPTLKDLPIDYLDGEKVFIELCVVAVVAAIAVRIQWQRRQPPPRVHRTPRLRRA